MQEVQPKGEQPNSEHVHLQETEREQAEFSALETLRRQKKVLAIYGQAGSINPQDGSRNRIYPADVHGRFINARHIVFLLLIGFWAILPWIRVQGRPAMFLNIEARQFFVFGQSFNAQDFWLFFFVIVSVALGLFVATTVAGRLWCGWACPQTVFLEGFYRPVERLIEGPRNERLRRDLEPMSAMKFARKLLKHFLFVVMSFFIAHMFLAYFVSMPSLLEMMQRSPSEHPSAFFWAWALTAVFYFNYAWFREQLCLVICPYGRMQSVLMDDHSLVVGYDAQRGEPRGKGASRTAKGDCVDCGKCVAVCPTGIDIRNGLQIDCIACTQCIDACDEVMDKLKKPRGLVRYDSLRGLQHKSTAGKWKRPRLLLYGVVGLAILTAGSFAFRKRQTFAANVLRIRGAPYVIENDLVRNTLELHVVNRADHPASFTLRAHALCPQGSGNVICGTIRMPESLELGSLAHQHVTVIVQIPRDTFRRGSTLEMTVHGHEGDITSSMPLLGPLGRL